MRPSAFLISGQGRSKAVSAARRQTGADLFDSAVMHHNYVTLTIGEAEQVHD